MLSWFERYEQAVRGVGRVQNEALDIDGAVGQHPNYSCPHSLRGRRIGEQSCCDVWTRLSMWHVQRSPSDYTLILGRSEPSTNGNASVLQGRVSLLMPAIATCMTGMIGHTLPCSYQASGEHRLLNVLRTFQGVVKHHSLRGCILE